MIEINKMIGLIKPPEYNVQLPHPAKGRSEMHQSKRIQTKKAALTSWSKMDFCPWLLSGA